MGFIVDRSYKPWIYNNALFSNVQPNQVDNSCILTDNRWRSKILSYDRYISFCPGVSGTVVILNPGHMHAEGLRNYMHTSEDQYRPQFPIHTPICLDDNRE